MKAFHLAFVVALAGFVSGCAGSVSAPTPIQALSKEQKNDLRLSDITADAASDVTMSDGDFGLICQKVRGYIQAESPKVFDGKNGALKMNMHFTKFDRGNALARGMMMGMGQIVIEADVMLLDSSGKVTASYKVAKDFALGGIAGATTSVDDVEEGFAKSAAMIVK